MNIHSLTQKFATARTVLACSLLATALGASAATTDLAPAPLVTTPTASVLPNVFLMMDDSGSMAWDYMPDNAGNFGSGRYGAASNHCNGVFYNPASTYLPPVTAAGVSYPDASFTAAWKDGYNTATGTVNLSTSFVDTGGDPAQPAFYFTYSGAQTTEKLKDYYNTSSAFYTECNSTVGAAPGLGKFTKVVVGAAEQTNFANWYSYYRTRMLMMKTATGLAFKTIGSTFRVGMATMNNNNTNDVLPLAPFDAVQKGLWYGKLYAVKTGNSTPLREALSNAGRMYAMKLPGNTLNGTVMPDPIEYSCQQNFTILTTDGFWNGPTDYNLSGGTVGNQDGMEVRPMYDGSNVTSTTTTPYTTVQQRKTINSGSTTAVTWLSTRRALGAACMTMGTPPNLIATAPTSANDSGSAPSYSGSHMVGLAQGAVAPDSNRCYAIGTQTGGSALNIWMCRGSGSNAPNYTTYTTRTNSASQSWYLVSSLTGNSNSASCVSSNTAFGYASAVPVYACPGGAAAAGYNVTVTPVTMLETIAGGTTTSVDNYTANQQTTQTTTNGVVGPTSALTPALSYVFTNNVSTVTTGAAEVPPYTWNGGVSVPGQTYGPWVDGASTTTCIQTASLPAIGWYWDTPQYSASSTAGTTTTTILSTVGPTAGTPTVVVNASGGTSDTLADVAEYYYVTDLRTVALGNNISGVNGTDISNNNVPSSGADAAAHQHMTLFTLGLGARGKMVFSPNYQTAAGTDDYYAVAQGLTANSATGICSWQANNTTCNWPTPVSNGITTIDDLWHAAVNGRGTYFSATNPSDLGIGLTSALAGVSARLGSSAAATTSTAFITQGDNFLFRSSYVSLQWTGELIRQQLDVNTGAVLPTVDWSAQSKLDAQAARTIYFFNSASANKLSAFFWGNLSATQQSYFDLTHIQTMTQSCALGVTCLSAGNQTLAAGNNLVNFIRGDRTNEGALADNTKYYRQRLHILGDIVDSESVYIKSAFASYNDPGYSSGGANGLGFKGSTTVTTRKAMVYVGANDGMLHAFRASDDPSTPLVDEGGQEDWAYIPSFVMPNLYKLADKGYDLKHQFYVDGSPVPADICVSNCTDATLAVWKTILVGGLNNGGQGYFALDVTDPASPKALWEFTDANMGYTYGNPKVVKLKNGTWVVVVTSGYNNVPPFTAAGDGKGHLYVLNAYTGALITDISTGNGIPTDPSGLARIDIPVASPGVDTTALAAYGGDLHGNLWRFDINGTDTQTPVRWTDIGAVGFDAQLMATLLGPTGTIQPITSKPLLTMVGTTIVVNVGTGRYLGSSDLADTSQQSFYAIKDPMASGTVSSTAIWGNPRTQGTFVKQTQTATSCPPNTPAAICNAGQSVVVSSNTAVNFSSNGGWYLDFAHTGERNNTDPAIMQGTLLLTANIPNTSSCSVGGDSYLYQLDYRTGGSVSSSTTGVSAIKLGNELASRPVVATLADGTSRAYVQGSGGTTPSVSTVWKNDNSDGVARRVSWRELIP